MYYLLYYLQRDFMYYFDANHAFNMYYLLTLLTVYYDVCLKHLIDILLAERLGNWGRA